jgi:hypothetical protein
MAKITNEFFYGKINYAKIMIIISINEIIMATMKMVKIIMEKPTMVKLLTMNKMNLAKIKVLKIIMVKPSMVKLTIILNNYGSIEYG